MHSTGHGTATSPRQGNEGGEAAGGPLSCLLEHRKENNVARAPAHTNKIPSAHCRAAQRSAGQRSAGARPQVDPTDPRSSTVSARGARQLARARRRGGPHTRPSAWHPGRPAHDRGGRGAWCPRAAQSCHPPAMPWEGGGGERQGHRRSSGARPKHSRGARQGQRGKGVRCSPPRGFPSRHARTGSPA